MLPSAGYQLLTLCCETTSRQSLLIPLLTSSHPLLTFITNFKCTAIHTSTAVDMAVQLPVPNLYGSLSLRGASKHHNKSEAEGHKTNLLLHLRSHSVRVSPLCTALCTVLDKAHGISFVDRRGPTHIESTLAHMVSEHPETNDTEHGERVH